METPDKKKSSTAQGTHNHDTSEENTTEIAEAHKDTAAEAMDRRHKRIAQNAQKKAIDALAQLAPEDMTANEARQLLKTAQDIERKITRRDPDRQREDVQTLLANVWEAAKRQS
jgi:uncharacterized protein YifN (PemK superfamily)